MKKSFSIISSALLSVVAGYGSLMAASAEGPPNHAGDAVRGVEAGSRLVVYVNPAMIPDHGICNLFSDRISRVDFLFYEDGAVPIRNLDRSVFTLDLPEGMKLRSVALWNGWGVFGGKHYEFRTQKVDRDGMAYTRYYVPLPGRAPLARAEPVKGDGYAGKSNHQCKLFLEPAGSLPETFKVYWKVEGDGTNAEGAFPVRLFSLPNEAPAPKRLFLLAMAGQIRPPWSDLVEIESAATMLRDIGISWVPSVNRGSLLERDMPDIWSRKGFRFTSLLYEPMPKGDAREQLPELRDYLVGLDGKRAKGFPAEKYHQRLYCPISLNTPGRAGFERMKQQALQAAAEGAEIIDWDLEGQTWTECFCEDCREAFSRFAGMPLESVKAMKPIDFILSHPRKWYNFRSHQTATFYRNMKKAVQEVEPRTRISANSLLVAADQELDGLGPGFCTFAEDPRLLDSVVDFHTIDMLTGSAADPVFLDAVRRGVKKPIIGTAGCAYSIAYNHNYIAGRRMRADKEGLSLGYNRRGELQRLGILSAAASGAVGIRVPVLVYNEVVDAEVALQTAKAAADLRQLEDCYLDWSRNDEALEVVDLTEEASPWLRDSSIIAGGPWRVYYDRYGGRIQFRVHTEGTETRISLFNWDPFQEKEWLVRFRTAPSGPLKVINFLTGEPYALEENAGRPAPLEWTPEQLSQGITVTIPSAGYVVLAVGKSSGLENGKALLATVSSRKKDLEAAGMRTPVTSGSWRRGEPVDLRKDALYRIERTLRYLPEGTVPKP